MERRAFLPGGLAVAGALMVLIGIHQDLLLVRPAYEGAIETGWDGPISHEERLLAQASVLGLLGGIATVRWRFGAVLPLAVGGVVLSYSVRAVGHYARDPGLYTGVPFVGRATSRYVLGLEPYMLVGAGLLFVASGVVGIRSRTTPGNEPTVAGDVSRP
ncbi:hypothetical protein NGM10_15620 (plasmid) [Halorussus salilacus]|uniref:hypothetical protein n=1 Tax=Halorussus salilacus TaxID=2953750 RepID=UPI00209E7897|nr:hypothetical protein [Halorussus salilacus]USZ69833.1 hypothetical protein NGM10_15620 [Halorussus salilacus]